MHGNSEVVIRLSCRTRKLAYWFRSRTRPCHVGLTKGAETRASKVPTLFVSRACTTPFGFLLRAHETRGTLSSKRRGVSDSTLVTPNHGETIRTCSYGRCTLELNRYDAVGAPTLLYSSCEGEYELAMR